MSKLPKVQEGGSGEQYVFIVGCPRSGTTWLQLLLAQHPAVATTQETNIFANYVRPLWEAFKHEKLSNSKVGLSTLIDEERFNEICAEFVRQCVTRIAQSAPSEEPKEVILEKTPRHVFDAELILKLFPQARFVHLVRDPRAVAASLIDAGRSWGRAWAPRTAADAAMYWERHVLAGRKISELTSRCIHVKYESLLGDPIRELGRIFAFLELTASPAFCLQTFELCSKASLESDNAQLRIPDSMKPGQKRIARKASLGSWREELSAREIATVERIAAKTIGLVGYPISTNERPVSWWSHRVVGTLCVRTWMLAHQALRWAASCLFGAEI